MLWLGFTGAIVAAGRLRHIQMDVIGRLLPPGPRIATLRLTTLAAAAVCAVLARASWLFLGQEQEFGARGFLGIATWQLYAIIFVGFAAILVRFLARALTRGDQLAAILAEAHGGELGDEG